MPKRSAVRISKRTVDAIASPSSGDLFVFDADQPGFGVRAYASGRRIFVYQYRDRGGRTRRLRLGEYGAKTCEQARNDAKHAHLLVSRGENPSAERAAEREAPTVQKLLEIYAERFARSHKKPRTIQEDERMGKLHILPALGMRKVNEVTGEDIATLRRAMGKTPIRFNACRALLSHAFNLALRAEHGPLGSGWGLSSNPCAYIPKYPTRKRERFLSQEEFAALGKALASLATGKPPMRGPLIAAIQLLALTGARRDEIRTCRWEYVDFAHSCLRLPDSKTGAKVIPLPIAAVAILKKLRADNPFGPWVIPGVAPGSCTNDLEHPWQRIRKAAKLDDVRLHDLRHSHASTAVVGGVPLRVVGAILGHKNTATTERYAHVGADPIRQAAETVGALVASSLAGTK